jgi:hypothetical protein
MAYHTASELQVVDLTENGLAALKTKAGMCRKMSEIQNGLPHCFRIRVADSYSRRTAELDVIDKYVG